MTQWTQEQERVLRSPVEVLRLSEDTRVLLTSRYDVEQVRDIFKHVDSLDDDHPKNLREIQCALEDDGFYLLTSRQVKMLPESIAILGLSVRTINGLEEQGIFTIRELLGATRKDLLAIANVGDKTIEEIFTVLEAVDFYQPGKRPLVADPVAERRREIRAQFGFTD